MRLSTEAMVLFAKKEHISITVYNLYYDVGIFSNIMQRTNTFFDIITMHQVHNYLF